MNAAKEMMKTILANGPLVSLCIEAIVAASRCRSRTAFSGESFWIAGRD